MGKATKAREKWRSQIDAVGYVKCGICDEHITDKSDVTVDHILPKSKGGSKSSYNLQPAHPLCNFMKGDAIPPNAPKPANNSELRQSKKYRAKNPKRKLPIHHTPPTLEELNSIIPYWN